MHFMIILYRIRVTAFTRNKNGCQFNVDFFIVIKLVTVGIFKLPVCFNFVACLFASFGAGLGIYMLYSMIGVFKLPVLFIFVNYLAYILSCLCIWYILTIIFKFNNFIITIMQYQTHNDSDERKQIIPPFFVKQCKTISSICTHYRYCGIYSCSVFIDLKQE